MTEVEGEVCIIEMGIAGVNCSMVVGADEYHVGDTILTTTTKSLHMVTVTKVMQVFIGGVPLANLTTPLIYPS